MAKRKKQESPARRFFRDAGTPVTYSVLEAHWRGESPFVALLDAMRRQAMATIAEDAYDWVCEEPGREVRLLWKDGGVLLCRFESDGSAAGATPIFLDRVDAEKLATEK